MQLYAKQRFLRKGGSRGQLYDPSDVCRAPHGTKIVLRQNERKHIMSWQFVGDLTIRDITKEVVLDGEYSGVSQTPWNTYSAGFSLRGKVNRKDWGLNWNMVLAGGGLVASDEITLVIDLELTRPVEVVETVQACEWMHCGGWLCP